MSRIYPACIDYEVDIPGISKKYTISFEPRYCPVCYNQKVFQIFGGDKLDEYYCLNCKKHFNKTKSLTKKEVRITKIDNILK